MDNQKVEKERREYNKKILINTFKGEWKNKKEVNVLKFAIECIEFFVAFYVANWIVEQLSIHSWFLGILITVVIYIIIRFLSSLLKN